MVNKFHLIGNFQLTTAREIHWSGDRVESVYAQCHQYVSRRVRYHGLETECDLVSRYIVPPLSPKWKIRVSQSSLPVKIV